MRSAWRKVSDMCQVCYLLYFVKVWPQQNPWPGVSPPKVNCKGIVFVSPWFTQVFCHVLTVSPEVEVGDGLAGGGRYGCRHCSKRQRITEVAQILQKVMISIFERFAVSPRSTPKMKLPTLACMRYTWLVS